ncbi:hypothetical protein E1A91_D12G056200v1 [Gossypium mustelinum]|uniref:Uncharacterized protein n=4 Tax=Gossypium TaxID=3633 RepID=A0A5J5NUR9_GOSBA|nr:hypothetical protein ES319_D12G055800v1 [Gossypium barbadense]TYG39998.1 hypothetical protein ES288_D12G058400v1 [Gossypium darwinii]TYI49751.1 hypothetical protein E1A91_D12G056200v1 [Gossypium mustelinum]
MIDVEKLISYSDDLVEVLNDKRDINNLTQCFQHFNDLRSHCDADSNEVHRLLREYEEKIEACKKKTEQAKLEVADGAEMESICRRNTKKSLKKNVDLKRSLAKRRKNLGFQILNHASNNVLDGLNMSDGHYFYTRLRGHHSVWDSHLFNYGS